ncbi:MAG: lipid-binding SYLF domain-containing protein [Thermoanaerobaculia bacterium]
MVRSDFPRSTSPVVVSGLVAVLMATLALPAAAAASPSARESEAVVSAARRSLGRFQADPEMGWFRDHVGAAVAVLIVPKRVRAGLIFGGSGGVGVLLARDSSSGEWGQPVFYNLGGASVGLQAGGERSEVIFLLQTRGALDSFLSPKLQLGAEAAVAAGPVGAGAGENVTSEILTFVRSKGLYAGATLDGTVIQPATERNAAYYGFDVTAADVIVRKAAHNAHADGLREDLSRTARPLPGG